MDWGVLLILLKQVVLFFGKKNCANKKPFLPNFFSHHTSRNDEEFSIDALCRPFPPSEPCRGYYPPAITCSILYRWAIPTVRLATDDCIYRHKTHTQDSLYEKTAYPPQPTNPKTDNHSFLQPFSWPSALPTPQHNYHNRLPPGFGSSQSISNLITLLFAIAACSDECYHRLVPTHFIRQYTQT